jgi:tryptophan 2,3-dioxygenase
VLVLFREDSVDERNIGVAARAGPINPDPGAADRALHVLETMTPLDFLDFRDFRIPASLPRACSSG